jgi:hypothetical protein
MAYWVTGTATSSLRIYWEMRQAGGAAVPQRRVEVPTGVAEHPGEITRFPRAWVEHRYHVTRWSTPARGGHFAAMEAPDAFVDDVRASFLPLVDGRPGPDDGWVPTLVASSPPLLTAADLDVVAARLAGDRPLTPTERADLAHLVNEVNRLIGDGYAGVARATDSPAFLRRQLAHARRRFS